MRRDALLVGEPRYAAASISAGLGLSPVGIIISHPEMGIAVRSSGFKQERTIGANSHATTAPPGDELRAALFGQFAVHVVYGDKIVARATEFVEFKFHRIKVPAKSYDLHSHGEKRHQWHLSVQKAE
jgi:hypothetical protein